MPVVPPGSAVSFSAEDVFIRSCHSQIFGNDVDADPKDRIGPLTLFLLSDIAPNLDVEEVTPDSDGELGIQKYVTQLEGDDSVWLAISASDRPHVSLIYDAARWGGNADGRLPLEAGDDVVRFDACDNSSGYTQYNGDSWSTVRDVSRLKPGWRANRHRLRRSWSHSGQRPTAKAHHHDHILWALGVVSLDHRQRCQSRPGVPLGPIDNVHCRPRNLRAGPAHCER
ncbi:MAG: hypothetical protein OEZ14_02035 [Acidimicrobiia bacterium]|nr:hypothetical protein [Acidimicrobiia bacterium]